MVRRPVPHVTHAQSPHSPLRIFDDAVARRTALIAGRFSCGGNTYHEPSSWRKNMIESGSECEAASTCTQRQRSGKELVGRVSRILAVRSSPNHFSMIHRSDCFSALISTLQPKVILREQQIAWAEVDNSACLTLRQAVRRKTPILSCCFPCMGPASFLYTIVGSYIRYRSPEVVACQALSDGAKGGQIDTQLMS
jgi:hypothetical protein